MSLMMLPMALLAAAVPAVQRLAPFAPRPEPSLTMPSSRPVDWQGPIRPAPVVTPEPEDEVEGCG